MTEWIRTVIDAWRWRTCINIILSKNGGVGGAIPMCRRDLITKEEVIQ